MGDVLFTVAGFNVCWYHILGAVIALIIGVMICQNIGREYWEPGTTDGVLIQYPPHVRITRTGLKYYNQPPNVELRRQLNVPILPPIIFKSPDVNAMGAVPIIQPHPPSQAQVANYPPGSTAIPTITIEEAPVSVKLGVPPVIPVIGAGVNIPAVSAEPSKVDVVQATINGCNDEVESYN